MVDCTYFEDRHNTFVAFSAYIQALHIEWFFILIGVEIIMNVRIILFTA